MKLSRTVTYAVQASLQLAQLEPGTPIPCSRLAAEGKMPERFLLQILRNLVTHGILRSTRGVDGGYMLHKPAGEITLLEIIEAIEGPLEADPLSEDQIPAETRDKLAGVLSDITETTRRKLALVTLAQLLTK